MALAGASAASAAPTCTDSWVGGDGNWFVASNWSTGAVPTANDAVCITAPGTYTVTVPGGPSGSPSGQAQADTLQLGATSGTQKLVIQADNSCGDSGGGGGLAVFDHGGASTAASIGANGQVELTQDANTCSSGSAAGAYLRISAGSLSNAGLITSDAGPVNVSATTGRLLNGSVTNAGGKITIATNTTWTGATFDNAGTITFPVAAALLGVQAGSGATFINDAGGSILSNFGSSYVFVDNGNTLREAGGQENSVVSRPGSRTRGRRSRRHARLRRERSGQRSEQCRSPG